MRMFFRGRGSTFILGCTGYVIVQGIFSVNWVKKIAINSQKGYITKMLFFWQTRGRSEKIVCIFLEQKF